MARWSLRIAGVLLLLTALALALSRAPDRSVESLVARWAPPPSDFVDLDGQLVHLRDVGPRADPAPLVLLHGTSASLHTWDGWVRGLADRHRVITLDLPGFGLTGPYTGRWLPADYSGPRYAQFVVALLDRLGVRRFAVGGNSLGGEVAWRVALAVPDRVTQLILVDSAGLAFAGGGSVPLGWRVARSPALAWLAEEILPRALVAQGLARTYGDPSRITSDTVDRYFELTLRAGNRRALAERLRQMRPGDAPAVLAPLRMPTLVVWGGRDGLIPPAVGTTFRDAVAGSKLVVFDDLGHVPQEEDPARTVAAVRAFLD